MLPMLTIFLSAFVFGVVFCLSPGAILAETLRRGLQHGFAPALCVQVGSLLGDALWALIGLTGLALLFEYPAFKLPLGLACALYLAWLGIGSLRDAWHLPVADSEAVGGERSALAVGAALSLTNPKNIVYWGALGTALAGIVGDTPSHAQTLTFFGGFMLASVLCCFVTAGLVELLRTSASDRWQRVSYGLCGVALLYLAGLALRGVL
jgi:chemosensory pili system protein ChpE